MANGSTFSTPTKTGTTIEAKNTRLKFAVNSESLSSCETLSSLVIKWSLLQKSPSCQTNVGNAIKAQIEGLGPNLKAL